MPEFNGFHALLLIVATIIGIYVISVRNRFKTYEHNIRASSARIGATIGYARSIDRHADRHTGKAHRHVSSIANKGAGRGRRWRPGFLVDFNPWPEARAIEVIIPAMQVGLSGRDQEYQTRLALIEAIRIYNRELDQVPGGTVADHFWHFRHYSYRFAQGSGSDNGRGRGRRSGARPNPHRHHARRRSRRGP